MFFKNFHFTNYNLISTKFFKRKFLIFLSSNLNIWKFVIFNFTSFTIVFGNCNFFNFSSKINFFISNLISRNFLKEENSKFWISKLSLSSNLNTQKLHYFSKIKFEFKYWKVWFFFKFWKLYLFIYIQCLIYF